MSHEKYAILPCNGLDKAAGVLARETALGLSGRQAGEIVCPVLYHRSAKKYGKLLEDLPLLVIDGCRTACASNLAKENGVRISRRLNITDYLKGRGIKPGKSLELSTELLDEAHRLVEEILATGLGQRKAATEVDFAAPVEYESFTQDKYVFRVPRQGFLFNENDCWARVVGSRARIGVSDFVQNSASDFLFFEPPQVGAAIEQFGEAGSLESTKTALDIIAPLSGTVVAVNVELEEAPEIVNADPYEKGWAVELELADFEGERELLMDCAFYLGYLKKKVEREFYKKERE